MVLTLVLWLWCSMAVWWCVSVAEAERARRRRPGESGGPAPSAVRALRAPASPLSPPPHAGLATCAPCTPPLSPHSREPCASFLAFPDCSVSRSFTATRPFFQTKHSSFDIFRHTSAHLRTLPVPAFYIQSEVTGSVGASLSLES